MSIKAVVFDIGQTLVYYPFPLNWFARIIEWEFVGFSVDRCFDLLLNLQETIWRNGRIEGTLHRYLIVAKAK